MSPFFHIENQEPPGYRLDVVRTSAYRAIAGAWREPVILACSGGVDSSALVVLAREALRSGSVGPCLVAHVDHRSRQESASEQEEVRRLAETVGLPFEGLQTQDAGEVPGESMESVWRQRRYGTLAGLASRLGVRTVVTAHTIDDQVETILMRLFAGSGQLTIPAEADWQGVAGELRIIRPLIDTSRSELESILRLASITPVIDPSNEDTRYRRNAVRHQVVPAVAGAFPGFEHALVRSARLREEDAATCDRIADAEYRSAAVRDEQGIGLPVDWLAGLDTAISTRVIRLAVREVAGTDDTREVTHERIAAVLAAAGRRGGAVIELPYGIRARTGDGRILIGRIEVETGD